LITIRLKIDLNSPKNGFKNIQKMLKSFSIGKEKYQLKVLYTELIIHFYIFLYRKFSPEFIYVSNSFLKKVRFVLNEN
jgi:hypothetical protein